MRGSSSKHSLVDKIFCMLIENTDWKVVKESRCQDSIYNISFYKHNLIVLLILFPIFFSVFNLKYIATYSGFAFMGLFVDGGGRGREWWKNASLPKICYTYPTTMKLGTVIFYLKKIPKNNINHMVYPLVLLTSIFFHKELVIFVISDKTAF